MSGSAVEGRTDSDNAEARLHRLRSIMDDCGSVCIGYSGGVDSVFLAVVALDRLGASRVLAVTGLSPSYPSVQRTVARTCSERFGIPHVEIRTDELEDENYASNPSNRCYYCKAELWPKVRSVAAARGLRVVLDGSNADDVTDHRPGAVAARENGVRSPLQEAGLTKQDIRLLSQARGLPTWDQPASPCLASRLPYGVAVTPERLRQVERAETALRDAGYREFRVRHHDDCVRIEIAPRELQRARSESGRLAALLDGLELPRVLLDLEGYRRGALNETLVQLSGTGGVGRDELPPHEAAGFHADICVLRDPMQHDARLGPRLRAAGFRYIAAELLAAEAGPSPAGARRA